MAAFRRVDRAARAEAPTVPMPSVPTLAFEPDGAHGRVVVRALPADDLTRMRTRDRFARHLRVMVADAASSSDDLPAICGRHDMLGDTLCFTPRFPFERGLTYRATFESVRRTHAALVQTIEFFIPPEAPVGANRVTGIFPSGDRLPANLLRFHVGFSRSMQRGRAEEQIALLDAAGDPVPDVLYRPPIELWDRGMRFLTVLLDPGRLKRRVGPNRALGPPLAVGRHYTLRIGRGMVDGAGRNLDATVDKRFRVVDAIRERIAIDRWSVARPAVATREPLLLGFPGPLDRAALSRAIGIVAPNGSRVDGRIGIDRDETRWRFTPASDWRAGDYRLVVAAEMEDVCGNTPVSAFDRPLPTDDDAAVDVGDRSIAFSLS